MKRKLINDTTSKKDSGRKERDDIAREMKTRTVRNYIKN
jgi:hypothetical protein